MTFNDWMQCGAVVVLLAYCVIWILRRMLRGRDRDVNAGGECQDCPLSDHCNKVDKNCR